jgi:hypothetical protein
MVSANLMPIPAMLDGLPKFSPNVIAKNEFLEKAHLIIAIKIPLNSRKQEVIRNFRKCMHLFEEKMPEYAWHCFCVLLRITRHS